jgi:hypothetical protein
VEFPGLVRDRGEQIVLADLREDSSEGIVRGVRLDEGRKGRVEVREDRGGGEC